MIRRVQFGLGLVSLGRRWGFRPAPLPSASEARALLSLAVQLGVTVFDTAPAYGASEALVGEFFRALDPARRRTLTLSTKLGEHWDPARAATWVDHSESSLRDSLDRSFDLLGAIDVLQVHKATAGVLRDPGVWRVLDAARARSVSQIGASVSDLEAGSLACEIPAIDLIQFPFNARFQLLAPLFPLAAERGKRVWTNRPFSMGAMLHEDGATQVEAYRKVLEQRFEGVILTGTVSPNHLREDWEAFEEARGSVELE